jgi:hypothetical protein
MDDTDIFIDYFVYPKADSLFNLSVPPIDSVKDTCIFVIDTNVLLLPFTISGQSIQELKKVYVKLKNENRLIIPGQVAREFVKNRPEKIKEIFQRLHEKRSKLQNVGLEKSPLLNELPSYEQAKQIELQINKLFDDYKNKIGEIIEVVQNWVWNDPVSLIYKELFTPEIIFELKLDEEDMKKKLERRYAHNIPPGYKDKDKPDAGIGDLLIWYTILEIGKNHKRDVVFVSMEQKTDWFHRSNNKILYPRFELVNEFNQYSDNKSFYIIRLSDLLKLSTVGEDIVKEIRTAETTERYNTQDFIKTTEDIKNECFANFKKCN